MSISSRVPFLGIGTGRCGTKSLSEIVGACRNATATHEAYQMYWYQMTSRIGDLIRDMREGSSKGVLIGEVNLAAGPHVEDVRSSIRDTRVICLHRDRESTVQSFVNFGSYMLRPGDKRNWVNKASMDGNDVHSNAVKCFPMIDAWTVVQAYEFYWEYYQRLMDRVREPVMHVETGSLSDDATIGKIFDFLEIPESDRVMIEKRQHNTIPEVERRVRGPVTREQQVELLERHRAGT